MKDEHSDDRTSITKHNMPKQYYEISWSRNLDIDVAEIYSLKTFQIHKDDNAVHASSIILRVSSPTGHRACYQLNIITI